jgi:putative DNA primase/helicase
MPSARALVAELHTEDGQRLIHHHRGEFHRWNGRCYRPLDAETVRAGVWHYLEDALRPAGPRLVPFQPTRARVGNVLEALAAVANLPGSVQPPAWLDDKDRPRALDILPVDNGLLHLPSGELLPATPAFFGFNASGVRYDPQAPPPARWLRFLDEVFEDDDEAKTALQECFGYFLTPDTRQQKIFLLEGDKRSGKGTIARVLTALIGRDNVVSPTLASLSNHFGLEPLISKSVAIVADMRLSDRSDHAVITERLLSISGEDEQTVPRKYKSAWNGRLAARFLIMTNVLPQLADPSGALPSRFVILKTAASFLGREDHGLTDKLLADTNPREG